MEVSSERWIDGLQFSSLFWPPPEDPKQREAQITAYVDYFGQFTSDQFPEDIAELIRSRYPTKVKRLLDEVLAKFVLHHPEHGHAVLLPIISCIIDGTLTYDKISAPFSSFISLVCPAMRFGTIWSKLLPSTYCKFCSFAKIDKFLTYVNEYSEQWALACGEILRVLTHYNRPIYKSDHQSSEAERSSSGSHATTSRSSEGEACPSPVQKERRPLRPLSLWITDILLVAPLGIRSDYFRWCGGVMGKYTTGGELKPPISACVRGSGKHPQLMPSTPRWAVANGAGVILSVCDEEVSRYETATLTAAAVPALLLPPPTTSLDEHLVAGLPALEPYARLFHRYYAIATPSTTQKLLLGLLEAPPSWAPDALDAAVQLVELLRAAEEYASGMRLPRNWMHLHFLRAIGTAMSMRVGIAADTAAALLFRILSQPALLFPPLRQAEAVENENESRGDTRKQVEVPEATVDATAQGIASMFCAHGPEVEWRICTIWEAAYGLIPLSSSAVDLPEIVVASPLQPPVLSWNLYLPLLKVLDYLPRGSPSEACLMRIFIATVEAIVLRTFPPQPSRYETKKSGYLFDSSSTSKNLAVAELRTMIHSLFLESCPSMELSSRLLFVVLTVCLNHEALSSGSKRLRAGGDIYPVNEVVGEWRTIDGKQKDMKTIKTRKQGPVGAFDSYVMAAICALACELQLFPLISKSGKDSDSKDALSKLNGSLRNGMCAAIRHTYRILGILEALFSLKPSSVGTSWSYSSNEIIAAAMVAAHISELFRRSKAKHTDRKSVKSGEMDASDLANYLTKDRHLGFSCSAQVLLRSVLAKKQELCISVVSLLWHKLVASPETQLSEESTSAQQGWRQVVDSLCNVVSASPTKASTAIVLQYILYFMSANAKDSSASDLLLRATDGMLIDGKACTLPQLEVLSQDLLSFQCCRVSLLMQCRLPAITQCLSHPSAHVRAFSMSVLREILVIDLFSLVLK
ncbi:hypothetical protein GIB67_003719 [Kingdonia uniflora]|uniref:Gigantea n=1 Tax=Kingdonia uniflora TaxID=39325 RepID=A0A7J7M0I7_9MAGN|nr:hypothetical protein GIB67_003719 [Kingdonia uniflora]